MKEKSDYVMLPPKGGKPGLLAKVQERLPLIGLILAVALVSWLAGRMSDGTKPQGESKQAPEGEVAKAKVSLPQTIAEVEEVPSIDIPQPAKLVESSGSGSFTTQTMPKKEENGPGNKTGGFAVVTEPTGAKVQVRDLGNNIVEEGVAPMTLTDLEEGFYEVTINRLGYQTERSTIEVVANRIREIETIRLSRSRGTLEIKTTQPAKFELFAKTGDDSYELIISGDAPTRVPNLPVSVYQLSLTREGWPTVSRKITLAADMVTEVEQDFPEGGLVLTSDPDGAEVWLKGQHQEVAVAAGVTPLQLEKLPVGAYEVLLRHEAGLDQRHVLRLLPNDTVKKHTNWSLQSVRITSDPPGASVFSGSKRIIGDDNPVTPMMVKLPEGNHSMYAVKPGLKDVHLTFDLVGGEPVEPHFLFQYGSAQITTEPEGAQVMLNGDVLGITPLLVTNIVPGKHVFQIWRERYASKELSGLVRAGHRLDLSAELQYDPVPVPGSDFTNGLGQRMIWVAALDCWVEATETPQRAYDQIAQNNPSQFTGPDFPVNNVTWIEAVKFCEQLTISEKGTGFVPKGYRYQLPTDQQWTFFAEGTPLSQGVTSKLGQRQNPEAVGTLEANRLGLYDVRGNMWEWCRDWYTQDVFNREQQQNATAKSDRVGTRFKILRGGSWNRAQDANLALGYRLLADPNAHHNYETGFRVILEKEAFAN
ncbi:MAG: PEGA domain-containing protein [Verrucomicrobiota bacterium]